ncbi:MAG: LON peptidase substrate-binding domain-containing protein, partial [Allopontixanthobacter sediminis]
MSLFPLLPLRDIVVFPGMVVPLFVGRDKSVAALEAAMEGNKDIFLLAQLDPGCDDPERDDLYDTGVVAQVLQLLKLPDGTVRVLVEGTSRAELERLRPEGEFVVAEVTMSEVETVSGNEITAMMRSVVEQFGEYAKLNKKLGEGAGDDLGEIDDAGALADAIAASINTKVSDKQALLTEPDPRKRLEMV